jgi:hypothetical protein
MIKSRKNLLIDGIMFLLMMALAGTGFVRKYILLSGSESKMAYGFKVHMTLMGINRDGWAQIHLYLGFLLLALLLLHIILHWKQIMAVYRKWIPDNAARLLIMILFIAVSLILLLFPFLVQPAMY